MWKESESHVNITLEMEPLCSLMSGDVLTYVAVATTISLGAFSGIDPTSSTRHGSTKSSNWYTEESWGTARPTRKAWNWCAPLRRRRHSPSRHWKVSKPLSLFAKFTYFEALFSQLRSWIGSSSFRAYSYLMNIAIEMSVTLYKCHHLLPVTSIYIWEGNGH